MSTHHATDARKRAKDARLFDTLTGFMATLAGFVTVLLALNIAADVLLRNIAGVPMPGTLEVTQYVWMPALVFLALAYTEHKNEHIRAEILVDRLSPRLSRITSVVLKMAAAVVILCAAYYALLSTIHAASIGLEIIGGVTIAVWPMKILMTIALVAYAVQLLIGAVTSGSAHPDSEEGIVDADSPNA